METRTFDWLVLAMIFSLQSQVFANPILAGIATFGWLSCLALGIASHLRSRSKKTAHV